MNLSKAVRYSNFGISFAKTKLYAIKDKRATIEVASLASKYFVGIHSTNQATHNIKNTGTIIL
ncbi:hypothetical protein N9K93_02140 [Candidatus Pelagibacter bacterium]|nr:hypothetical protein [Candidatus Pelagibacter bacterium]